jgi:hypothetical protein
LGEPSSSRDDGGVDESVLAVLDREGWIAIPGVLDPEAAADLAERATALLGGDDVRQNDKRAGGTRRAAELLDRLPEIRTLFEHPDVVAAVTHLVGPDVPITDVALRSPSPGFGEQSLHADDQPIARAGDCRAVTAIVALCPFTSENGSTAVVPGTHLRPDLQRRPERHRLERDEIRLLGPAGTAFVFSAHLLHRGTRNTSAAPRPALQTQWRVGVAGSEVPDR